MRPPLQMPRTPHRRPPQLSRPELAHSCPHRRTESPLHLPPGYAPVSRPARPRRTSTATGWGLPPTALSSTSLGPHVRPCVRPRLQAIAHWRALPWTSPCSATGGLPRRSHFLSDVCARRHSRCVTVSRLLRRRLAARDTYLAVSPHWNRPARPLRDMALRLRGLPPSSALPPFLARGSAPALPPRPCPPRPGSIRTSRPGGAAAHSRCSCHGPLCRGP